MEAHVISLLIEHSPMTAMVGLLILIWRGISELTGLAKKERQLSKEQRDKVDGYIVDTTSQHARIETLLKVIQSDKQK